MSFLTKNKFPPDLKYVAALPCEMQKFENNINSQVHITRSNSPDLSLMEYTICAIMNGMSTSMCVQNVAEVKTEASAGRSGLQHGTHDNAVITIAAFHTIV